MSLPIAEQLKFMAIEAGKTFHVGYQRRADAGVIHAKLLFDRLLAKLEFGKLRNVAAWNYTGKDRDPSQKPVMTNESRPEIGTFKNDRAINILCHDINLLNWFLPGHKNVTFSRINPPGTAILKIEDVPIILNWDFNEFQKFEDRYDWREGLEFYFERASLRVGIQGPLIHDRYASVKLFTPQGQRPIVFNAGDFLTPFQREMREFIDAVKNGDTKLDRINEAVEDMILLEKIFNLEVSHSI